MADALAWMHDPAEFDALVHEIFVAYDDEGNTPRVRAMVHLTDPALEAKPIHGAVFVTRLFESPGFLLDRYTPAQIDAGIYRLLSWGELAWFPDGVNNQQVSVEDRIRCLRSAEFVYRDLFAPMYGNQISALGHAQPGLPSYACFMWWDVVHIWPLRGATNELVREDPFEFIDRVMRGEIELPTPEPNDIMINEAFDLFGRVLDLDSDECRASVLHGIGHHQDMHPERTRTAVAAFLGRNPNLRPELREYAERAAQGDVL